MANIINAGTNGVTVTGAASAVLNIQVGGTNAIQISTGASLTIAQQATIDGISIGQGAGNVASNTAFGVSALNANTTGANNTAIGSSAVITNTTGNNNTAVGFEALKLNTTGGSNVAMGLQSLFSNTTGSNIAIGYQALYANTTGTSNVAVGYQALDANTTGYYNTAVGSSALGASTTANANTAVGLNSLLSTTTGGGNTAIGYAALQSNTTGTNSVAVGSEAAFSQTTGYENICLGVTAARSITTGYRNIFIGMQTGYYLTATTTGALNTIIGAFSRGSAVGANTEVVLGYNLAGKGDNTAYIGGPSGAYNEKNVSTWDTTSDARIKKNIVDNHDGLDVIKQIRVRNFEYRKPEEITDLPEHAAIKTEGVQLGVIAQEIREVLPQCITENSTGVLSVSTDPLVWHLINAVKELSAQVDALKAKLGE